MAHLLAVYVSISVVVGATATQSMAGAGSLGGSASSVTLGAFSEPSSTTPASPNDVKEFLTLAVFGTKAGTVVVAWLLVIFLQIMGWNWFLQNTKRGTFCIALLVTIVAALVTGGFLGKEGATWAWWVRVPAELVMIFINSILVFFAAIGGHNSAADALRARDARVAAAEAAAAAAATTGTPGNAGRPVPPAGRAHAGTIALGPKRPKSGAEFLGRFRSAMRRPL